MHVLYVLCFYVVIVILYVLLCCHVRRNKDTHTFVIFIYLLKRAYQWSFSKDIVAANELLNKSGTRLIISKKMHSPSHCLNPHLPSNKKISYYLKNGDDSYVLPRCKVISMKYDDDDDDDKCRIRLLKAVMYTVRVAISRNRCLNLSRYLYGKICL